MIDFTKPVTFQDADAVRQQYHGRTKDLYYYHVQFAHNTDAKIINQQEKIESLKQELHSFKKARAYAVSFKFPPGVLAKILFAIGTALGITIAHNVYVRRSTRQEYKQEMGVFQKAIEAEKKTLADMARFRSVKLQDTLTYAVWLNTEFVDRGSSTTERARTLLVEAFNQV